MRIKRGGYVILSKQILEPFNVTPRPSFVFFLDSNDDTSLLSPLEEKESDPDNPSSFSMALSKSTLLCRADGMMCVIITPYVESPMSHMTSFVKFLWILPYPRNNQPGELDFCDFPSCRLIGSLVRKDGRIYSLAASGDSLYTGSENQKNKLWKDFKEFSRFKSNSGVVKTIVISDDWVFTARQDGKIRIWTKLENVHKRVGSLPMFSNLQC